MNLYIANVVDTAGRWHRIEVTASTWQTVKATARKIAKAQGVEVKFVNDFFCAG